MAAKMLQVKSSFHTNYAAAYKIIQTNFCKHIGEQFQFYFQRDDFLATKGVELLCQRLDLFLEKMSSPCLAFSQSESGFQPLNPSQNR